MDIGIMIPDDIISSKIYLIRNQKVMLDKDLSELYAVETKQLKRQVRRNFERFPEDFMFELSQKEFDNLRSQFGTSSLGRFKIYAYGIYRTRSCNVVECTQQFDGY